MEGRPFGLRGLADLAEHLATAGLVKANRVVLCAAHHANGFQHAQHAKACDVGGELGLVEAERDERDGAKVVDLVGLTELQRLDQRRQVGQIAGNRLDVRKLVAHLHHAWVVLALDHAKHFIALAMQELSEMLAVLAGDSGDECARHIRSFLSVAAARRWVAEV